MHAAFKEYLSIIGLKYSQVDKIGKKYNFAKLSEILI
jgi:hypothetical protein